jgi:hypothetical protein
MMRFGWAAMNVDFKKLRCEGLRGRSGPSRPLVNTPELVANAKAEALAYLRRWPITLLLVRPYMESWF